MSRLMDDLKRLNMTRKMETPVLVKEAEEPKPLPREIKKGKEIYLIGALIVVLVAVSALSLAISLKTIERVKSAEESSASAGQEILSRQQKTETAMTALAQDLLKQKGEWQSSVKDMEAQFEKMSGQAEELKAALTKNKNDLKAIASEQELLKVYAEDSVRNLQAADQEIEDSQALLKDQVKKITEASSYLYTTY